MIVSPHAFNGARIYGSLEFENLLFFLWAQLYLSCFFLSTFAVCNLFLIKAVEYLMEIMYKFVGSDPKCNLLWVIL